MFAAAAAPHLVVRDTELPLRRAGIRQISVERGGGDSRSILDLEELVDGVSGSQRLVLSQLNGSLHERLWVCPRLSAIASAFSRQGLKAPLTIRSQFTPEGGE